MKKIAVMILAAVVLAALPVAAQTAGEKDECLLAAKNCAGQVETIQKKVRQLKKEIKRGNRVYTKEELATLQRKLDEVEELLNDLNKPGGH